MRTNRLPHDYRRLPDIPAPAIRAQECAIINWISALVAWQERGLITRGEFNRLANEGPGETAHAAILSTGERHARIGVQP